MTKRILFTGGGSAGHVTVNIALIPKFIQMGWEVSYIGSIQGIEARLIEDLEDVKYYGISTGKLRRYVDLNNVKDPFRVIKGSFQAFQLIRKLKPNVLFSKGGFVSVPVVVGAWLNRVPIVIHESDITPGLANKLSMPFATKVCTTFPNTSDHINSDKVIHVGAIIREELKQGSTLRGLTLCDFTNNKPVLLIMGGSLGSQRINDIIRNNLHVLINEFQIIHICGKGQVDHTITLREYKQFEYIHQELADVIAAADIVVSRAGSNSIFEFLALHKPMLLIPLSKEASRGDQLLNAQSFKASGYCEVLLEEEMNNDTFMRAIQALAAKRDHIVEWMIQHESGDSISKVVEIIKDASK